MERATLVRDLYKACLAHDKTKERELLRVETAMVLKHRAEGTGAFDGTWTVVSGTCGDVPGALERSKS
jgi:hypothetical protein